MNLLKYIYILFYLCDFFAAPKCPDLKAPKNGYLTPERDEYNTGDMVFFDCFEHYILVGRKKLTCLKTGQWDYIEPTCKGEKRDLDKFLITLKT